MNHDKTDSGWSGEERRHFLERRILPDRRNLVRLESLGSDRRSGQPRRKDDIYWQKSIQFTEDTDY